ncbi:MAG TPA: hypothetical protein HA230_02775 [Candidatus Aenigmarchaeota archaeon]|nr:hypothetical protein [Candidatus Aenigmarchaeota archaeon]
MRYDIIHIEDHPDERKYMKNAAERQELTYLGLPCLQALKDALPESSARVYVVDGKFPRVNRGLIEQLAPEAIATIIACYSDARIVLFSSEDNIDVTAREHGADFLRKDEHTARSVVENLKPMIDEVK